MDGAGLLDATAAGRLAAARDGLDGAVRLRIADLEPGAAGIVEGDVRGVAPARKYARKRGGDGVLARVTLGDATGEVDLVLWDDETRLCRDGPLVPGAFVRLHGPTVKAGFRGGVELGLGAAELVVVPRPTARGNATGTLVEVGEVRPVGAPPAMRFSCDLLLSGPQGDVRVAAWDGLVKQARAARGARVVLTGLLANPFLDGWWTADPADGAVLALAPPSATLK